MAHRAVDVGAQWIERTIPSAENGDEVASGVELIPENSACWREAVQINHFAMIVIYTFTARTNTRAIWPRGGAFTQGTQLPTGGVQLPTEAPTFNVSARRPSRIYALPVPNASISRRRERTPCCIVSTNPAIFSAATDALKAAVLISQT